jgi:hypothetical protein
MLSIPSDTPICPVIIQSLGGEFVREIDPPAFREVRCLSGQAAEWSQGQHDCRESITG